MIEVLRAWWPLGLAAALVIAAIGAAIIFRPQLRRLPLRDLWQAYNAASLPHLKLLLMLGAGMVNTGLFVAGSLIIWRGTWPPALAEQRLNLLGAGTLLMAGGMLMVLAALTAVSVRLRGPGGIEAGIGSDTAVAAPSVTATASPSGEVHVTATPASAAAAAPSPPVHSGAPPPPPGGRDDLAS